MDNAIEAKSGLELSSAQKDDLRNIQENFRCRITVLSKEFREELYRQYPFGAALPCGRLEEGQIFVTERRWDPPEGFCQWAWRDLLPSIHSIHAGNSIPTIGCCTDGLRPVTFKLERIDAQGE